MVARAMIDDWYGIREVMQKVCIQMRPIERKYFVALWE